MRKIQSITLLIRWMDSPIKVGFDDFGELSHRWLLHHLGDTLAVVAQGSKKTEESVEWNHLAFEVCCVKARMVDNCSLLESSTTL